MSDVKQRTGASPMAFIEKNTVWDKLKSTNFWTSLFVVGLGLWSGNSEKAAAAGAAGIVGIIAAAHAVRLYVVTNKIDIKRWLTDSNTWAALLTVITTFIAVPPDLTAAIGGVVDAANGGSLAGIISALFYFVNTVFRLLKGTGATSGEGGAA